MQIKIVIPDELYEKIKIAADKNFRTATQEINYRLTNSFNSSFSTESHEIGGIPFPAFPQLDYSHFTSTTQVPPQSFAHAITTSHTHADTTPPGVQSAVSQTIPSQPTTTQITPDPHAGTIEIKPGILPNPVKDYTQAQSQSEQKKRVIDLPLEEKQASKSYKNNIQPTLTDIEIEQVDNEWDAEGHKYSTEDFVFDLKQLEAKLKEDLPLDQDPTRDPDYITLKKYFIKNDLRERFRSLLSDPQRFYPEEGVYDPPQIRYARAAFRKEKIDEDYIVALLSGTGADYRRTNKCELYTH